jgi:hypothetical protein
MAITDFQRELCRLVARNRIEQGESYVAGGVALNTLIGAPRLSNDIDVFHDTREALAFTWDADRALLAAAGYEMEVLRERPTFVEAVVRGQGHSVVVQWVCDSAYRFFPLVEHPDFGLTLHPFDLVTNKVLALVGRVEVRDWVDVIESSDRLQHLGYLAWAACGKDPGYNPAMILAEASRSGRYSAAEVAQLAFDGPGPDAAALSARWGTMLREAETIVEHLPPGEVGRAVLGPEGELFCGTVAELATALGRNELLFHAGAIRGALPQILTQ